MTARRTRYARHGTLAIDPKAWGIEIAERSEQADRGFTEEGDAAVVEIRGPLLSRAEGFWSLFCDDYPSIAERARAAFGSGKARVILRIDSPGGDAPGCFELARELRAMSEETGIPLEAYAERLCASAAYAIACSARTIIAAPSADVGSIGVLEYRLDWSAQNAAMGVRIIVVTSGEAKVDRHPDVPVTDEAIGRIQGHVDQFAQLFFDLVAEMRGGSADDYRALKGDIFLGEAGTGAGLVDRVGAWGDLIAGGAGASGEDAMTTRAMSYEEALDAMKKCADGDDEDAKKAKKSLKAIEDGEKEPEGEEPSDDEKDKEAKAKKAKAEEDEKKKKDEEDEAKAKALADNGVAMARELQELKAKDAARDERDAKAADEAARAKLFAQRPDFSEAQRKTLASVPLATLEEAVKTWPRVNVQPGSSASSTTTVPSEREARAEYVPNLTPKERELLAKADAKTPLETQARRHGNALQMPRAMTKEAAAKRAEELEAELKELG